MERIAPLAQILAEANGIDWQTLRGSGEGGMVVEQDILNYLSRIMSGEEEPPATPVDVPPADWDGDMNALPDLSGMSPEQLSRAGVDSDIAALLSQPRPQPSPEVPATPATASLDAEDMEFELDDDAAGNAPAETGQAEVAAAPVMTATPAMATWDWSASAPAAAPLPVSSPDVTLPELTSPGMTNAALTAPPVSTAETPAPQVPVVAAVAAAGGLGSLLSRLYQAPAEVAPQDTASAAAPAEPEPFQQAQIEHPEPAFPEPTAPEAPQSAAELPALELEASVGGLVSDDKPSASESSLVMNATGEDAISAPLAVAAETPVGAAQTGATLTPSADAPAGAVWFGTYLRRSVDFGAVSTLHGQLGRALGREVPLAFLVARAAGRHAADLGLSSVALHDSAGGRARSVAGEHLRAAVGALAHTYEGTPDLLVVDAGALDLDDLHYPHTLTLSVGRVQDGHAALSLSGNVDAAQGARFLADLDATLNQPILLAL